MKSLASTEQHLGDILENLRQRNASVGPYARDEIIAELEQNSSENSDVLGQQVQIINALAMVLAACFALSQLAGKDTSFKLILFSVSVLTLCAVLFLMASIGSLIVLRHHYLVFLEDRLAELNGRTPSDPMSTFLPHWTGLSTPVISLSRKRQKDQLGRAYSRNYTYLVITLLIACGCLIGAQAYWLDYQLRHVVWIVAIESAVFVLAVGHTVYVFVISTQKSRGFFENARRAAYVGWKDRATQSATGTPNSVAPQPEGDSTTVKKSGPLVQYFLYPRPNDWQKSLFVLVGCIFGMLISGIDVLQSTGKVLLVILVIDVLVYQARYQWNDTRGITEDQELDSRRQRMPLQFGFHRVVTLSVITGMLKLVVAGTIIFFSGEMRVPLLVSSLSILTLAALYERSRGTSARALPFLYVGIGYPLRFVAGLWSLWPAAASSTLREIASQQFIRDLPGHLGSVSSGIATRFHFQQHPDSHMVFTLLLVTGSLYCFGLMFVSLCWALKVVDLTAQNKSPRSHMAWLKRYFSQNSGCLSPPKYPLQKRGRVLTPWNLTYMISTVLYMVAVNYLIGWNLLTTLAACLQTALAVLFWLGNFHGSKRMSLWPLCFLPVLLQVLFVASLPWPTPTKWLAALLSVLGVTFSLFFCLLRNIDYGQLISFASTMQGAVLDFCLGKETREKLARPAKQG